MTASVTMMEMNAAITAVTIIGITNSTCSNTVLMTVKITVLVVGDTTPTAETKHYKNILNMYWVGQKN